MGTKKNAEALASAASLQFHKASKLVPDMRPNEYAELRDDIKDRGITTPLDVIGKVVLDGRHRLRIAKEIKLDKVPVRNVILKNGESETDYLLKAAVLRRHLSDDQRKATALLYARENPQPKGAASENYGDSNPRPGGGDLKEKHRGSPGQKEAARLMNVSVKGVEKASLVHSKAPKLFRKVHSGEMTMGEALRHIKKDEVSARVAKLPEGKYRVFYADPPWKYSSGGSGIDNYGPAERHYPAMSIDELCSLDIKSRVAGDAVLFLWVTAPMLEDSFRVLNAWGFKYKTQVIWYKVKHNYGHYFSVRHENLLVCTHGSCTPDISKLFESVQTIERSNKHSEKPEEFRKIIETLYPHGRRLELFARKKVKGWDAYGNEVEETPALAGNGR